MSQWHGRGSGRGGGRRRPAPRAHPAAGRPTRGAVESGESPFSPDILAAMRELDDARDAVRSALDDTSDAIRDTLDVRKQLRRHPAKAAAALGGAGFLAAGGPRRVLRSLRRRLPGGRDPYDGLLPDEVRDILGRSGTPRQEQLERALEADFAAYLRDKGKHDAKRPRAVTSLWRTYDTLVGPIGSILARLAERLASDAPERGMAPRSGAPGKPAQGR